jgi:hypothetical protein
MELLAEDQIVSAGATPNASVNTGASTYWLMATVVLKAAAPPSGQSSSTQAAALVGAPPAAQLAITAPAVSFTAASAVTRRDRWRFVYEALLENLSPALLCHHSRTRSVQGLLGLSAGWYANT